MSGTTPAGSLDALDASDAYRRANEPAELVAMIGTSLTPEADRGAEGLERLAGLLRGTPPTNPLL